MNCAKSDADECVAVFFVFLEKWHKKCFFALDKWRNYGGFVLEKRK